MASDPTSQAASTSAKMVAPASERNKAPILDVLRSHLPSTDCTLLEVASGAGVHASYFTTELPHLRIQPTDMGADALASIAAYRAELPPDVASRIFDPLPLDVTSAEQWQRIREKHGALHAFDAALNVNMIHISPVITTKALFEGLSPLLKIGAPLFLYGPFLVDGKPTTESNVAFDAKLKGMNPGYGLRDIADVTAQATAHGFTEPDVLTMPANNFMLIFRKT
jgi:hypothetical protein